MKVYDVSAEVSTIKHLHGMARMAQDQHINSPSVDVDISTSF